MGNIYNSYFFTDFYKQNGGGDYFDEKIWRPFFERLADQIIEIWNPQKVLDAGCAKGYLVEALRERGVEAYGIDISDYAIASVRESIKSYCNVQNITDALPESYPNRFDLITCIEVLEHLYPEDAKRAVNNLCKYSDVIVFSSTPDDIEDQTHVNVQLAEYWVRLYAENSFYRNVFQNMEWLSPWAVLYEKRIDINNVVNEYERKLRILALQKNKDFCIIQGNLHEKETELEKKNKQITELEKEAENLLAELKSKKCQSQEYGAILEKQTKEYTQLLTYFEKIERSKWSGRQEADKLITELKQSFDEKEHTWIQNVKVLKAELEYYKEMAAFENMQKHRAKDAYDLINNATMWKATKSLRKAHDFARGGFKTSEEFAFEIEDYNVDKNEFISNRSASMVTEREHLWPECDWNGIGTSILREQQMELSRREMEMEIAGFKYKPLISVVVPLYNPPMEWLPRVIETLQAQVYPFWELCVADDGSPKEDGRQYMSTIARIEPRIKFTALEKNGGISVASNAALELAVGEFIALVDQDDEITQDAFFWMIKRLNEKPQADFIYSDECKLDSQASVKYFDFYFKPDWSPRLLMNHMYTGHLSIYRTEIVRKVGGFRSEFDFSQDYDLALRVSDITRNIEHVERVLYFWRAISTSAATGAKDFARVGNMHALKDWYNRHGLDVIMQMMPRGNYGRIVQSQWPLVSVIIPTDNAENLSKSIHGLSESTNYSNLEIVPVTNSEVATEIEKEFAYLETKLQVCRYDKPYNFSDKCNVGAQTAHGEVFLFYNDDVVPERNDWLERLVELLALADVGSVSPMLTKPDEMIQYAGMITGTPGLVGTSFNGYPADDYIYGVYNHMLLRDVTVLSGACFVIKRELFCRIGGFDALNTPNGHSDVDLSFKIMDEGFYNVYTPYSRLVHMGNHSWHEKDTKDKADIYCLKRWGKYLSKDSLFTDSQKKMFYVDFSYEYKIHSPKKICNANINSKDILFVTHELSLTGAPIVLFNVVKFAIKNGLFPVVLSFKDGALRKQYEELGVTVIVDKSVEHCSWILKRFAQNFDIVFANTVATYPIVELLRDSLPNIYWWLHEGEYAIEFYKDKLPCELAKNVNVLFGGEYVKQVLTRYGFNYSGQCLFYSVDDGCIGEKADMMAECRTVENKRYRFLFVGSIELRKGPDILIDAIQVLEERVSRQCEFLFIGAEFDPALKQRIREFSETCNNVKILNPVNHEELQKFYDESDMLIVPSRDDPCPVVAIEAMMHSLPVMCSDKTGTSYLIENGKDGFVFENENSKQIAQVITHVVENPAILLQIGKQGRYIYEAKFKESILEQKLKAIMQL